MYIGDRSHQSVARRNQRDVLSAVARNGPLPRTEIALKTGLHTASVSRITKSLIEAGLLREKSEIAIPGKRGRRFVELEIDPAGGYVIGIAINAFEQSVTLANIRNERIDRVDLQLTDIRNADAVISGIIETVRQMIVRNDVPRSRLLGASVAVTGVIDTETGDVIVAPPLGWENVALEQRLADGLNIRVTIENLPNAVNLAEYRFGIAAKYSTSFLMNTALGVGSSLMLNGYLHRGHNRSGVLTGNVTVPAQYGDAMQRTLDLAAGGRGVLVEMGMSIAEAENLAPLDATQMLLRVIDDAGKNDKQALEALSRAGHALGAFMAHSGSVIQPEAYIISGLLSRVPAYANACKVALRKHLGISDVVICVSEMTVQAAARWLAIGNYLIDNDLETADLDATEAA
ncbi:MAG: ROK family transcriptional regulator [Proteobacteria bacterium]|nr:ROK family transcriptional regulator [Pseudomonadota bacterium]